MQEVLNSTIFLTGFMGAGKTSVGMVLACLLNVPFVDLDRLIESKAGVSIPEIFRNRGEEGFRMMETNALLEVASMQKPVVCSTGGGIVTVPDNIQIMEESGTIVFLNTPLAIIRDRVKTGTGRPLWNEDIEHRYYSRLPFYRKCAIEVAVSDDQTVKMTAMKLLSILESMEILK